MLQTGSICPPVGLAGGCSPGGQLQHPLQTCYFQTCPELRPRGSHRAPTSSPSCPGGEAPLPRGFPRGAALCSPLRFAAPHPAHRRLRMMQDAPRCIPNLCPRAQPDLQAARGSLPLGPQKPTQGSSPEPQLISVSLSPRSPPSCHRVRCCPHPQMRRVCSAGGSGRAGPSRCCTLPTLGACNSTERAGETKLLLQKAAPGWGVPAGPRSWPGTEPPTEGCHRWDCSWARSGTRGSARGISINPAAGGEAGGTAACPPAHGQEQQRLPCPRKRHR